MLKKDSFMWGPKAEASFEQLKISMSEAPVLGLLDFNKIFVIETDVCGIGIGAVLM